MPYYAFNSLINLKHKLVFPYWRALGPCLHNCLFALPRCHRYPLFQRIARIHGVGSPSEELMHSENNRNK